ncbi:Maf family protein, partial [bacterium]|nr:Maf family protein [bacterium]
YVKTYKPLDKAGAYGIQELPNGFVKEINGDLENVIGISSKIVKEMLQTFKHELS